MDKKAIIAVIIAIVLIFVVYYLYGSSSTTSTGTGTTGTTGTGTTGIGTTAGTFTFTLGMDNNNYNLSASENVSLETAKSQCLANSQCVGFVFVGDAASGNAYFKYAHGPLTPMTWGQSSVGGYYVKN